MASNGLSPRRHHFPRPAACKASNPNDCPAGEIVLETLELLQGPTNEWRLKGHWLLKAVTFVATGDCEVTVNDGAAPLPFTVNSQDPFDISIFGYADDQKLVLFCLVTDPNNCKYLAVAKATAPPLSP